MSAGRLGAHCTQPSVYLYADDDSRLHHEMQINMKHRKKKRHSQYFHSDEM